MKRLLTLLMALAMTASLAACGGNSTPAASGSTGSASSEAGSAANADFKVGAIYINSKNDTAGYTYAHHNGITKAMEELGLDPDSQLVIVDEVNDNDYDGIASAVDTLVAADCNIIFGISFGYMQAMADKAQEYPDVIFSHATGYMSNETNFNNYFGRIYQARYLTGVAAGLAACGKKPFTNTFAMFAAGRAWEQVRNSIAYPRLNVKVVGSHGGLSVGEDGATHQCIEDYAIMRAIPNMMVVSPCDGPEMRQAVRALLDYDGPAYLRLGRLAVESVTDAIPGYTFHLGQGVTLRDGSDATVIATGMMVQMALKAAEMLQADGIDARVIDMHTIKPLDEELLLRAARETGAIVTTEEHNIIGGLGSAVAEFLSENCPVPVIRHGVNDQFGRSGKADQVLAAYGLTPEVLADKARQAIAKKG